MQKEKTSEMERRELGKNLAEMKKSREDDELRQAAEERRQAKVNSDFCVQFHEFFFRETKIGSLYIF